jgi:hypothetical protein
MIDAQDITKRAAIERASKSTDRLLFSSNQSPPKLFQDTYHQTKHEKLTLQLPTSSASSSPLISQFKPETHIYTSKLQPCPQQTTSPPSPSKQPRSPPKPLRRKRKKWGSVCQCRVAKPQNHVITYQIHQHRKKENKENLIIQIHALLE